MCNNYLNQTGNSNQAARALKTLEFLAVNELFLTPQARYADLVLPVTSTAERSDLTRPWPSGPYFTFVNRAIEPLGECQSDLDIVTEVAARLGFKDFNPYSEDQWLRMFVEKTPDLAAEIKDFDQFKREGIHRISLPEPIVAFRSRSRTSKKTLFPRLPGKSRSIPSARPT
jgi:anaerobic dimethyl sulfoxide reductase subunit A